MTAVNHVATGAVTALAIKVPELAIPLALLSHYICDAIPHFGIHEDDHIRRNTHWLFKAVTAFSIISMLGMLVFLPYYERTMVSPITVLTCMIAAILPDIAWVPLYIQERKTKQEKPLGRFNQLHQAIQWYEKPLGLTIETGWLLTASYVLFLTVK